MKPSRAQKIAASQRVAGRLLLGQPVEGERAGGVEVALPGEDAAPGP